MAVKSIIEVDVQSDSFKAFQAQWQKYREQVAAMPGDWAKMGKATAEAAAIGQKAFAEEAAVVAGVAVSLASAVHGQNELTRAAKGTHSVFKDLASTTGSILGNITSITWQVLKWGALAATGGALGMGKLAASASNLRATSGRLGINSGQLQAANAIYGSKGLDAESIMKAIAYGQSHPGSPESIALIQMGLYGKGSAGDVLPQVLQQAAARYKSSGGMALGYEATGIGSLVDYDTSRYLGGLGPGELTAWQQIYKQTSGQLQQPVGNLAAAQEVGGKFRTTEAGIENDLIAVLAKAKDPVERFSDDLREGADALKNFILGVKGATPGGGGTTTTAGIAVPAGASLNDRAAAILAAPHASPGGDLSRIGNAILSPLNRAAKEAIVRNMEDKHHLPRGMLRGLWGAESSFGARTIGPDIPGMPGVHAFGDFQFLPQTGARFGINADSNFAQQANAAASYMEDIIRRHGGNWDTMSLDDRNRSFYEWNGAHTAAGYRRANNFITDVDRKSGTHVVVTVNLPAGADLHASAVANGSPGH